MDIKSKIAGGVLAMASLAPCTYAQSAETAAMESDTQDLMEVVVTARKREERLQEVPLTITAVTSDAITAAGIRDIKHLSTMTPGFHFDNAGSRQNSQPRMRGMDINTANPTRQNASFFIDFTSGSEVQQDGGAQIGPPASQGCSIFSYVGKR